MKKFYLAMCLAMVGTSIPCTINAQSEQDECELIANWHEECNDTILNVKKYDDNGKTITVFSGNQTPEEKEQIESNFNNTVSLLSTSSDPTGPDEGWAPVRNLSTVGYASSTNDAQTHGNVNFQAYMMGMTYKLEVSGGETVGFWMRSGNADKIVLRQKYTFSGGGLSLSVSWPAGFSLSPSSSTKTQEWVSDSFEDVWHCSAEHETVTGKASNALVDASVVDGTDIYKGSTCYKVRCSAMSMSLRKAYYGSNY